ncbi:type IV pilus modification protein PilV [Halomonas sp. H10-9-1]|uniref:type IV pilus modification protein PilV n=1 Tax=Halomonas sp. H10-9-1 TaxID=2950871 RepID=UPI0032DF813F
MKRGGEQGFTLIEALIALLVLSIGLLGVAAMQLKSLQGAHAAYQRSIATLAAQDAQERLWAQMALDSDCPIWGSDSETSSLANDTDWEQEWAKYLPGFADASGVEENSNCEFTITISWNETRFSGEGDNPEFTYRIRLPQK